jgi:putative SOS response-associated peptidase YedK
MCNLYSIMRGRAEIAALIRAMTDRSHNQPPMSGVYPDYEAPVVVNGPDGAREMRNMRWGMPSPKNLLIDAAGKRADALRKKGAEFDFAELLRLEPDKGVTNVRNTTSSKTGRINAHWAPWLCPANRCLVPFTSFAEPDQDHRRTRKNIWFALDESRPLAFFAGVWTPHACVRAKSKGWEEIEAYGFLTTDSEEPVKTYHAKAMPVILTEEADRDLWLSDAPWSEVAHLQRPLAPGALRIVAEGTRQDSPAPA